MRSKQNFLKILAKLQGFLFEISRINIMEVRRFCIYMF